MSVFYVPNKDLSQTGHLIQWVRLQHSTLHSQFPPEYYCVIILRSTRPTPTRLERAPVPPGSRSQSIGSLQLAGTPRICPRKWRIGGSRLLSWFWITRHSNVPVLIQNFSANDVTIPARYSLCDLYAVSVVERVSMSQNLNKTDWIRWQKVCGRLPENAYLTLDQSCIQTRSDRLKYCYRRTPTCFPYTIWI